MKGFEIIFIIKFSLVELYINQAFYILLATILSILKEYSSPAKKKLALHLIKTHTFFQFFF